VDFEGKTAQSDQITFGIPVGGKVQFAVISPPPEIYPGEEKVIEITYQNTGSESVRDAEVRLSTIAPFTGTDDTAYLGSIPQGATVIARFDVTLDSGATIKNYGLDSEIRYHDALDKTQISDTIKVQVNVLPSSGLFGSNIPSIIIVAIVILAIIGVVYFWRSRRKSR
jgi:hypothetical protein